MNSTTHNQLPAEITPTDEAEPWTDDLQAWSDDPAQWITTPPRTTKVRPATLTLLLVLMVAAGLWGGATIEKHYGTAAARTQTTSASRAGGTSSGVPTGFEGLPSAADATSGTITAVKNNGLTVVTSAKKTVQVVIDANTVVTRTGLASAGTLTVGDRVTIVGTTHGRELDATTVTATASGVTATPGTGASGRAGPA
jgi:hypothetical protein